MSIYPAPKSRNGVLNSVFNTTDYIKTPSVGGGTTQATNDARYLRNSGVVVSSAQTTFNNSVSVAGLLSANLLNAKQSSDPLVVSATFTAAQSYSFNTGMVYYLGSTSTAMTTVSITDLPITASQSYIFTFILKPSAANSAYYIKPNTDFISVNGGSVALCGLQNFSFPAAYTYLVQQITVINTSATTTPSFVALTSISGY